MRALNIEVILKKNSVIATHSLMPIIKTSLALLNGKNNTIISKFDESFFSQLHASVKAIIIEENPDWVDPIDFSSPNIVWHMYTLSTEGPRIHFQEDDDENQFSFATHLTLPSESLHALWENLYYEDNIKQDLLQYAETILEFSERGIGTDIIGSSHVILLHGPPGTGKTSLCKALAQKLSVRMQKRFSSTILVEIHSNSLFSRFYSVSAHLVKKAFQGITEILQDPDVLVCLLIDEIESVANDRKQCMSGPDSTESIRVVNGLLIEVDRIKSYRNVLILTTSNITKKIDNAFMDRADIKQYLGLPGLSSIYKIYHSCIQELIRTELLKGATELTPYLDFGNAAAIDDNPVTKKLKDICEISQGLSGRSLRKVPLLARALYLSKSYFNLGEFLDAMFKAIDKVKINEARIAE